MDLDSSLSKSCSSSVRSESHGSHALIWALFLLLAGTAWARGGSSAITPWLQFVMASIVVVVFVWEALSSGFVRVVRGVVRDPVLYLGLALLVLTGIQWHNSGLELFYDSTLKTWHYSEPHHRLLPFSFQASEAREVSIWFYCALVTTVAMRSKLMSRRGIYRLWRLLILNSCLLGLFGMVQFLTGTDHIFWVKHLPYQRFFASFGYTNHAGSYFLLSLFLSASMLVRRIFRHDPPRFTIKTALLLIAFLFNLLCANLTLSRYAILVSWVTAFWIAIYVARRLWSRGHPALRLNMTVVLACCGLLALYASFSAAGEMLGQELSTFLRLEYMPFGEGRLTMFRAGLSVWTESPLFGVGPWGFRHLVGLHLDESLHFMLVPGSANIHNDFLQYLVESGCVGFLLIVGIGVSIAWRIRLRVFRNWMPGLVLSAGICAIGLQSTFDLPLRSPAVLYCWLAIACGVAKISAEKLSQEEEPERTPANPLGVADKGTR